MIRRVELLVNDICGRLFPHSRLVIEPETVSIYLIRIIQRRIHAISQFHRLPVYGKCFLIVQRTVLPKFSTEYDPMPAVADHMVKSVFPAEPVCFITRASRGDGHEVPRLLQLPDSFRGRRHDLPCTPVCQCAVNIKKEIFFPQFCLLLSSYSGRQRHFTEPFIQKDRPCPTGFAPQSAPASHPG